MKRTAEALIECARLSAIGVSPYSAVLHLGVSERTVFRWLILHEVKEMVRVRADRWRRDERRRKNGEHRAWLKDPVAQAQEAARVQAEEADRRERQLEAERARYGGKTLCEMQLEQQRDFDRLCRKWHDRERREARIFAKQKAEYQERLRLEQRREWLQRIAEANGIDLSTYADNADMDATSESAMPRHRV